MLYDPSSLRSGARGLAASGFQSFKVLQDMTYLRAAKVKPQLPSVLPTRNSEDAKYAAVVKFRYLIEKYSPMSHLKAIFSILSPTERRRAFVLLGLMVVGMIAETLGIGLVVPAVALFMQTNIAETYPKLVPVLEVIGSPSKMQLIAGCMVAFGLLYFIKNIFLGYLAWQQNKFNNELLVNLSNRLFTLYLRQPYAFHLQRNSSELIRNIIYEVGYFLNTALNGIMTLLTESLILIGIVLLLFTMEPLGALGFFLTISLSGLLFYRLTHDRITRWGGARLTHDALRIKQVQHGLGGIKDVLLLGRESEFLNTYNTHNKAVEGACLKLAVLQALPRLWFEIVVVNSVTVLILLMIAQGRDMDFIVPVLALFGTAAVRLMPSCSKILAAAQAIRFGESVLEMLKSEFTLELPASKSPELLPRVTGAIELKDITFTYAGGVTKALHGVSLTILEGETVGLIGPSGSGKSTLVDLILGLIHPDSGQVRVNGKPICEYLRGWQNHIGYVPQSIFLTDDTVRRNVAFGLQDDKINDDAVIRAVQSARLADFIQSLPEGLETIVGERGVRLSGGQRQRIGIARALYHDPKVIVLDEATSALDGFTESEVMDAINALKGAKTIIIVAHRLSTVEGCDRVFRLEAGKLVESGPPSAVLHKPDGSARKEQAALGLIA